MVRNETENGKRNDKKQNETASLLKAIAHPARIAIVEYLMNVEYILKK